jgi:hypothetical protein
MTIERSGGFTSVGQSLRRHWSSHNVSLNSGLSEAELEAFETKYSIVLPDDFQDYFRCVNGMPPDEVDDGMIRFWMLEEVTPLPAGAPQYSHRDYVANPETLFLFADYSIWAHAYAIRLRNTALESNEIVIIGHKSPKIIAHSFSEFVDTYITTKDALH